MNELGDAIADMDQLFTHLSASLKRERNSLNRLVSLPSNVVACILGHANLSDILAGSKVCHAWRVAALTHPSIWSIIDFTQFRRRPGLLQALVERSGVVPLTLFFEVDPINLANTVPWPNITKLLKRSGFIANLVTATLPPNGPLEMPSLNSLHIIESVHNPLDVCLGDQPNLRHLSINCRRLPLPILQPGWNSRLVTLHLRSSVMTALEILNFVVMFPLLKELSLKSFQNVTRPTSQEVKGILDSQILPSLRIISLRDVASSFIWTFLNPSLIQKQTLVYASPFDEPFTEGTLIREDPVRSVWIDFTARYMVFDHKEALTKVIYTTLIPYTSRLPRHIRLNSISSFTTINGEPLTSTELAFLGNLTRLSFTYQPHTHSGFDGEALSKTLNQTLIFACPHLAQLDLGLRGSITPTRNYRDEVEDVLVAFTQSWLDTHDEFFDQICLLDEMSADVWTPGSKIYDLVNSLRIGPIDAFTTIPLLPKVRWFHP